MRFVLTSDLDWASEYCIEHFLGIAGRFSIKPTFFVTHASGAVRQASDEGRVELGIHPNFLPGSTQGHDIESVIDHVLHCAKAPVAFRCHRYVDNPQIASALQARGLTLDSNLCLHLERDIRPVRLANGSLRLPVFFEDDVHWDRGLRWSFGEYATDFFSPGLKVLNFHPFFVALNIPDREFYLRHKSHIRDLTAETAAEIRHRGTGACTFLIDALSSIVGAGHRFATLGELAGGYRDGNKATGGKLE